MHSLPNESNSRNDFEWHCLLQRRTPLTASRRLSNCDVWRAPKLRRRGSHEPDTCTCKTSDGKMYKNGAPRHLSMQIFLVAALSRKKAGANYRRSHYTISLTPPVISARQTRRRDNFINLRALACSLRGLDSHSNL